MPFRRSFVPALLIAPLLLAPALLPSAATAQYQSDSYKFLQAIRDSKRTDVVNALSKPGSQIVNTKDPTTGETALHITARRGDLPYTTFLLQKGADPNSRDARNNTPMMAAVDAGHGELVPLLAAGHANPNLTNASGETPLIRAVQRRDLGLVRELLTAKADPDQRDNIAGMSARDYAGRDPRATAIVKLLAETPRLTRPAVAGPRL